MPTVPALRCTEHFARTYAHNWRASVMATFLNPILYLAALGVGLGHFIDRGGHAGGSVGQVGYLHFVAPGLVAVTAMQTAASESTFPVMGALKWNKTYSAMLATPLRVTDVLVGHLIFVALRVLVATAVFLGVVALFYGGLSPVALADIPAGLLTGMAFATPLVAFAARQDNDAIFNLVFRFVLIPLFLFSSTFFPLSQLPLGLQVLAWATPLWHGVDLCRTLTLGTAGAGRTIGHVAYLAGLAAVGGWLARGSYRRRLRL